MKVIREYQLFRKKDLLEMPINAEIRSLSLKEGIKTMYVELDTTETELVIRRFEWYDTEEELPADSDLQYLGILDNIHITERLDLNPDN